MALIPQSITNTAPDSITLEDVRGFGNSVITVAAGATVDLLVLATDEDLAKSSHLALLTDANGPWTINSTFNTAATQAGGGGSPTTYIISTDTGIQFAGGIDGKNGFGALNTYAGTQGTPVAVQICVTNGLGVVDILNNVTAVSVSITGGTASTPTINGEAGPVVVTMTLGTVNVLVDAGTTGTVLLGLGSPTHPQSITLDVTDTAQVTLS